MIVIPLGSSSTLSVFQELILNLYLLERNYKLMKLYFQHEKFDNEDFQVKFCIWNKYFRTLTVL